MPVVRREGPSRPAGTQGRSCACSIQDSGRSSLHSARPAAHLPLPFMAKAWSSMSYLHLVSKKKKIARGKPCSQPSSPTMHVSRGSHSLPRNEQRNPRQGSSPPGRASLCRACPCPRPQQGRNQRWGHPSSHQGGARQGQSAMLRPGSPRAHPGTARTALLSRTRPPPGAAASRLTRTCCFHSRWG